MEFEECTNPYGAYRYRLVGDSGYNCGSLKTEDDADELRIVMERNENGAIEYAVMTRLVDSKIVETILINNVKENEDGTIF
jgi:hypothetical protein